MEPKKIYTISIASFETDDVDSFSLKTEVYTHFDYAFSYFRECVERELDTLMSESEVEELFKKVELSKGIVTEIEFEDAPNGPIPANTIVDGVIWHHGENYLFDFTTTPDSEFDFSGYAVKIELKCNVIN